MELRRYVDQFISKICYLLSPVFHKIVVCYFKCIVNVIIHVLHEHKQKVGFIATAQTLQRLTFVVGLAEIAAHFAEFRIIYCCVDNTVVIVVIYDTNKNNMTRK